MMIGGNRAGQSMAEALIEGDGSAAADVGARVLKALAAGREKANRESKARAQQLAGTVFDLAHADQLAGKPERGRAGRIARKTGISERHINRILATLFSVSDSEVSYTVTTEVPPNGKRNP